MKPLLPVLWSMMFLLAGCSDPADVVIKAKSGDHDMVVRVGDYRWTKGPRGWETSRETGRIRPIDENGFRAVEAFVNR